MGDVAVFVTDVENAIDQQLQSLADQAILTVRQALYDGFVSAGLQPQDINGSGDYRLPDGSHDAYDIVARSSEEHIEFEVVLTKSDPSLLDPIRFDLGLPNLGFEVNSDVAVHSELDFIWNLGFGVSETDGFYLLHDEAQDEFAASFDVTIPGPQRLMCSSVFSRRRLLTIRQCHRHCQLAQRSIWSIPAPAMAGSGWLSCFHPAPGTLATPGMPTSTCCSKATSVAMFFRRSEPASKCTGRSFLAIRMKVNYRLSLLTPASIWAVWSAIFVGPLLKQAETILKPIRPLIDVIMTEIPVLTDFPELVHSIRWHRSG